MNYKMISMEKVVYNVKNNVKIQFDYRRIYE